MNNPRDPLWGQTLRVEEEQRIEREKEARQVREREQERERAEKEAREARERASQGEGGGAAPARKPFAFPQGGLPEEVCVCVCVGWVGGWCESTWYGRGKTPGGRVTCRMCVMCWVGVSCAGVRVPEVLSLAWLRVHVPLRHCTHVRTHTKCNSSMYTVQHTHWPSVVALLLGLPIHTAHTNRMCSLTTA